MKDEPIAEGGSLDLNYFEGGSLAKIESAAEQTAAYALTGFIITLGRRLSNQKHIGVICVFNSWGKHSLDNIV